MSPRRDCGTLNPCSVIASITSTSCRRRSLFSLALLFVGLDMTILNIPLADQLGAEGSALRWVDRAEAIATWTWTATVEIGLVAGNLLTLIPS